MIYLANAFSLQMLGLDTPTNIKVEPISQETVECILLGDNGFTSAIGHQDTANVLSNMLGIPVAMNRISVSLTKDDILVVAQVVGGRLPEGATTLPEGVSIKFVKVQLL